MTHRIKRCKKCKISYAYQSSGHGCGNELNDDSYCPNCTKLIIAALKDAPIKCYPRYLPIISNTIHNPATIEEFNTILAQEKAAAILWSYPFINIPGIAAEDIDIRGISYRKYYSRKNPEKEILLVRYELNQEGEVIGTW